MMEKKYIKKILFISLSNLGDIILTTPTFMALTKAFPEAEIDVFVGAPGETLFKHHSAVSSVKVNQKKKSFFERFQELKQVRKKRYDVVIDLKNSLLSFFSGARHRSSSVNAKETRHKVDEHLNKISFLGLNPDGKEFYLPVSKEEKKKVKDLMAPLEGKKMVVINPGAKSHLKRWSWKHYSSLADKLISELGVPVCITGNEDDKDVVSKVLDSMKEQAINLLCKTNLGELAELMKSSSVVITNDSAPLHVASAVNAPTVAVFGPSDERKYGPLADKRSVLTPLVKCRPCSKALCAVGPDEGCISQVSVEAVYETAVKMLNG